MKERILRELYDLNIPKLNHVLDKSRKSLLRKSLENFVLTIGKTSAKLSVSEQEKVETILAYALKAQEELEKEDYGPFDFDEEKCDAEFILPKARTSLTHDKAKEKEKKETIQHALNHLSTAQLQHPKNRALSAKISSLKKQNHILTKA